MWLRDTGVLGKMKDVERNAPPPFPDPRIKIDGRISVEQLGIGIAIYSAGMLLSLLCFFGELCTKKRMKKVKKNQRRPRKAILELQDEENGNKRAQDIIMPHRKGPLTIGHK